MTTDDPDRNIRCQDALQKAVQELVSAAISAGWSEHEVLLALADLVDHQLLALEANNNTDALIALLKRMT
ncbi:hypothetical protein [Rhizobium sp. BK284]|uniref:hypothetical protein n=1 Tax=unclassified Rhizobium TaxID=2613769 RepID=UPI0017E7DDCF|nr:hypothetical protein [Rhizobium sp. BK289]MBB3418672.1 hypothetical protein [Rhizobium sp. BK284]MBB3486561.1 hypothetical protein [Rhizobium sp. BK347]